MVFKRVSKFSRYSAHIIVPKKYIGTLVEVDLVGAMDESFATHKDVIEIVEGIEGRLRRYLDAREAKRVE